MTTSDGSTRKPESAPPAATKKKPPLLFECRLCGKVFDAERTHPTCPECDSRDVEQVG